MKFATILAFVFIFATGTLMVGCKTKDPALAAAERRIEEARKAQAAERDAQEKQQPKADQKVENEPTAQVPEAPEKESAETNKDEEK